MSTAGNPSDLGTMGKGQRLLLWHESFGSENGYADYRKETYFRNGRGYEKQAPAPEGAFCTNGESACGGYMEGVAAQLFAEQEAAQRRMKQKEIII